LSSYLLLLSNIYKTLQKITSIFLFFFSFFLWAAPVSFYLNNLSFPTKAMTTANSNNRASLLAGLRTGGVRSSTLDTPGSFNLRRLSSHSSFAEEDHQLNHTFHHNIPQDRDVPMTAAVDGSINRFSHHQAMNPNSIPFTPAFTPTIAPQAQVQMQILQLEMMRIQVCRIIS
jgi:hypothetical protein